MPKTESSHTANSCSFSQALIHVSTAYCCCNENLVEEKLYSIPGNPHDIIRSVDGLPPHILEQITEE